MLPVLGGEGKGGSLIGRIFGRQSSSKDESDSPRNLGNRAGTGSLAASNTILSPKAPEGPSKQWVLEPRQAGAALTTGVNKQGPNPQQRRVTLEVPSNLCDPTLVSKSQKLLIPTGTSHVTNNDSDEGKLAAMFDHNQAFKRSHTSDFNQCASPKPQAGAGRLSPLTTATALANVGDSGKFGQGSPHALASPSTVKAASAQRVSAMSPDVAMNLNPEDLNGRSDEELRKLFVMLKQQTVALKSELTELEVKKSNSGSGGSNRSPSIVVDFSQPQHQHRPSVMAQNLEQIKLEASSRRTSRLSHAVPGGIEEEDSGFIEDDHPPAPKVKPGDNLYDALEAAEQKKKKEEAARKQQQEKEAAEAAAAALKQKQAAEQQKQEAAAGPKRKYKLLSVYPLLAPSMRRDEWSMSNFKFDKKLHSGYASEVYRAQDLVSKEVMAVKIYNLKALGELNKVQLIREIRLHGNFTHRNIIELYVSFQEEHRVILAQRYAEGGDLLRALHKAGGKLTEKSAVQMVIQPLLTCLVYLHSKGITHRDIKPENILFDADGVLKLADFGLAINMNEEHAVTRAGTLHYMAPEVVKNPLKDHPNDFKNETRYHYNQVVDSWAVGCLAYELIVGFPPFMADTQQQVVKNINSMEIKYPKKMSDEMIEFCKAALQRDPANRATAAELMKHAWISLHSRRSTQRQLNFEAQGGMARVVADFAHGPTLAKAANAAAAQRTADHKEARVAPF